MTRAVVIRHPERSDYEQWRPLWDQYNAFYNRAGTTALSADITQMTWSRFFNPNEPVSCLVADQDGRLVGLAHYIFHRNTTMINPICYLQDLFTSEQSRGKGVGRALINAVYDRAKLAGSPRVYWHTHETNATAQALYDKVAERSGFIVYRQTM
jgi:GNAT superfamily N-acetyltransferase